MTSSKVGLEDLDESVTQVLDDINTNVDSVNTNVDSVKTSIGATTDSGGTSSAGSVFAKLNKIITDLTSHVTNWTSTRAGYIDTINTNVSTIKTNVDSIKTNVDSIISQLASGITAKVGVSVQRGVITIAANETVGTATISSVDLTKSFVVHGGSICGDDPTNYSDYSTYWDARLVLSAGKVTATRISSASYSATVAYQVVTFT